MKNKVVSSPRFPVVFVAFLLTAATLSAATMESRKLVDGNVTESLLLRVSDGYRVAYVRDGKLGLLASDVERATFAEVPLPYLASELTEVKSLAMYATPGASKGLIFLGTYAGRVGLYSLSIDVPGHGMEVSRLDDDTGDVANYSVVASDHYFVRLFYRKAEGLYTTFFDPYWDRDPQPLDVIQDGQVESYLCWEGDDGSMGGALVRGDDGYLSFRAFEVSNGGTVSVEELDDVTDDGSRLLCVRSRDGRAYLAVAKGAELRAYERVLNTWIIRESGIVRAGSTEVVACALTESSFIVLSRSGTGPLVVSVDDSTGGAFTDGVDVGGAGEMLVDMRFSQADDTHLQIFTMSDHDFAMYTIDPESNAVEPGAKVTLSRETPAVVVPFERGDDPAWLVVDETGLSVVAYVSGALSETAVEDLEVPAAFLSELVAEEPVVPRMRFSGTWAYRPSSSVGTLVARLDDGAVVFLPNLVQDFETIDDDGVLVLSSDGAALSIIMVLK